MNFKEKVLKVILDFKNPTIWEISKRIGDIEEVVKIIKNLKKEKFVDCKSDIVTITKKGRTKFSYLEKFSSLSLERDFRIDKNLIKKFEKYRNFFYFKKRKLKYNKELDQIPLTSNAIFLRISLMQKRGDLGNSKIACIGDDDFSSIAFALTNEPKEILVLDKDKDILEFIDKIKKNFKVKIKLKKVDFLKNIPKNLKNKYDVFVTEPPDTIDGMILFFSRGIDVLKKEKMKIGYIGVRKMVFSEKEIAIIQKRIIKMGFCITDFIPNLCYYENTKDELLWWKIKEVKFKMPIWIKKSPNKLWFASSIMRCESFKNPKPYFKCKTNFDKIKLFHI